MMGSSSGPLASPGDNNSKRLRIGDCAFLVVKGFVLFSLGVMAMAWRDEDILKAYSLNANCYITKPVELDDFIRVVKSIEEF